MASGPPKSKHKGNGISKDHEEHHPLVQPSEQPTSTVAAVAGSSRKQPGVAQPDDFNSWDESEDDEYDDTEDNIPTYTRKGAGALYERVHSQDEESGSGSGEGDELSLVRENTMDNEQEDDEYELPFGEDDAAARRRRRRRDSRVRKVYGGGRSFDPSYDHPSIPQRGILATSWLLFTSSISPAYPLLVPYAYSLTGLSFGIPLTILLLVLGGGFSHVILTVEARYVGARSYPTLASYVFPQSYGIKYLGRMLVDSFTAFVCLGRTLLSLYIASDLLIHIFGYIFPRASILHSKLFICMVIGLSYLLPALLTIGNNPRRRCNNSRSSPSAGMMLFVTQLPYLSVLLYPIILLIIGVSLKNLEDYPSLLRPGHPNLPPSKQLLHTPTLWSGVSILLLLASSNHAYTFNYYRSLKRKPASKDPSNFSMSSKSAKPSSSIPAAEPSTMDLLLTRYRWEITTLSASLLAALFYISFGLVGYMSLLKIQPNLFESLPKDHDWFNFARVLVLLTVLPLINDNVRPAKIAIAGLISIPRRLHGTFWLRKTKRAAAKEGTSRRRSSSVFEILDGDEEELEEEDFDLTYSNDFALLPASPSTHTLRSRIPKAKQWEYRIATFIVWASVIACASTIRDLGAIEEVLGSIGATGLGMIIPASFFIALFHIRPPRSILSSPESQGNQNSIDGPGVSTDILLLNKERQLQKKLMGKRLWMDLGTFGLLLPVGVVGMGRGIWAFATG